jgi:hypothetical protein
VPSRARTFAINLVIFIHFRTTTNARLGHPLQTTSFFSVTWQLLPYQQLLCLHLDISARQHPHLRRAGLKFPFLLILPTDYGARCDRLHLLLEPLPELLLDDSFGTALWVWPPGRDSFVTKVTLLSQESSFTDVEMSWYRVFGLRLR